MGWARHIWNPKVALAAVVARVQPSAHRLPIRVELHGYNREGASTGYEFDTVDKGMDVTHYVTSVSWTNAVKPPWETMDLTLKMPFRHWRHILPGVALERVEEGYSLRSPGPGFWVVLKFLDRGGTWRTVAWGRATRLSTGIDGSTRKIRSKPLQIHCDSWLSALSQSRIAVTPAYGKSSYSALGTSLQGTGFFYSIKDWEKLLRPLLGGAFTRLPGSVLEELWGHMAALFLPNTLLGKTGELYDYDPDEEARLSDEYQKEMEAAMSEDVESGDEDADAVFSKKAEEITARYEERVEANRKSSFVGAVASHPSTYAEQIPVVWDKETALAHAPQRVLQTARVPGSAVQAFANATPRGSIWSWLQATFAPEASLIEAFPSLEIPTGNPVADGKREISLEDGGDTRQLPATDTIPNQTELGAALGAQPVLMYRMRPTHILPLTRKVLREAWEERKARSASVWPERYEIIIKAMTEYVANKTGLRTTYGLDPIEPANPYQSAPQVFLQDEVHDWNIAWDDVDRVNGVNVRLPYEPDGGQVETYGLWAEPFLSFADAVKHGLRLVDIDWPFKLPGNEAGLRDRGTAFTDLAYHMLACEDPQFFGTVTAKTEINPWVRPGNWTLLEAPKELRLSTDYTAAVVGYVESVTNTIQVRNPEKGIVEGSTSLRLSRAGFQDLDLQKILAPPPLRGLWRRQ